MIFSACCSYISYFLIRNRGYRGTYQFCTVFFCSCIILCNISSYSNNRTFYGFYYIITINFISSCNYNYLSYCRDCFSAYSNSFIIFRNCCYSTIRYGFFNYNTTIERVICCSNNIHKICLSKNFKNRMKCRVICLRRLPRESVLSKKICRICY